MFVKSLLMETGRSHLQQQFQKVIVKLVSQNTRAIVIRYWDSLKVRNDMTGILQKIIAGMIRTQSLQVFIQQERQQKLL